MRRAGRSTRGLGYLKSRATAIPALSSNVTLAPSAVWVWSTAVLKDLSSAGAAPQAVTASVRAVSAAMTQKRIISQVSYAVHRSA